MVKEKHVKTVSRGIAGRLLLLQVYQHVRGSGCGGGRQRSATTQCSAGRQGEKAFLTE